MSLFDSIRYPINFPPVAEQIDKIPAPILHIWLTAIQAYGWRASMDDGPIGSVIEYYYLDKNDVNAELPLLKKVIAEYEPL